MGEKYVSHGFYVQDKYQLYNCKQVLLEETREITLKSKDISKLEASEIDLKKALNLEKKDNLKINDLSVFFDSNASDILDFNLFENKTKIKKMNGVEETENKTKKNILKGIKNFTKKTEQKSLYRRKNFTNKSLNIQIIKIY